MKSSNYFSQSRAAYLLLMIFLISTCQILASSKSSFMQEAPMKADMKIHQNGFIENKGQFKGSDNDLLSNVYFVANRPGKRFWLTESGLTMEFITLNSGNSIEEACKTWTRVDISPKGGHILKENIRKNSSRQIATQMHYFGNNYLSISESFEELLIVNVYPNIDWRFISKEDGSIKHEFIVHPGGDPNIIGLIYEGAGDIEITENTIGLLNRDGSLMESELLTYQGDSEVIGSAFKSSNIAKPSYMGVHIDGKKLDKSVFSKLVEFELDNFDKSKDLIIDPVLSWATTLGGNALTTVYAIDTDLEGSLIVVGFTDSDIFPATSGAYQDSLANGTGDIFISKFNSNNELLWTTYFGGSTVELPHDVICDDLNNIIFTGETQSADFPVQGAYQANKIGVTDAVLVKLNSTGQLVWSTYYGGSPAPGQTDDDIGTALGLDHAGNIWLTGQTRALDFPIIGNAVQTTHGSQLTPPGSSGDMFIAKFNSSGTPLYSTFYGGEYLDVGWSITVDIYEHVWVTGSTSSLDFNVTDGSVIGSGGITYEDGFVVELDSSGSLLFSTYLGGSLNSGGTGIDADGTGNVWVVGHTRASDFPVTSNAYQATINTSGIAGTDIFLSKFDSSATLVYSSFFGGNADDGFHGFFPGLLHLSYNNLEVDECGNPWLIFQSTSTNLPVVGGTCHNQELASGGSSGGISPPSDNFVARFSEDGTSLLWSTHIGGTANDMRGQIALDKDNNLITAGLLSNYPAMGSTGLPFLNSGGSAYFDNSVSGQEIYIAKFKPSPVQTNLLETPASTCSTCDGEATIEIMCSFPPYSVVLNNAPNPILSNTNMILLDSLCIGPHTVLVSSNCGYDTTITFVIQGTGQVDPEIVQDFGQHCIHDSIFTIDALVSGGIWSGSGIINSSSGDFDPNSAGSGVHMVYYEIPGSCGGIDSAEVTINSANANIANNVTHLQSDPGFAYQWVDCDNSFNDITNETGQTFFPTSNGNYAVIYTSVNGCIDTSACEQIIQLGISKELNTSVHIYPNPSNNGRFNLDISDQKINLLKVYNPAGKLLYYKQDLLNKQEIQIVGAKGMYIMELSGSGKYYYQKVIIE